MNCAGIYLVIFLDVKLNLNILQLFSRAYNNMGLDTRKPVFGGLRTQAQTSLRIRAV